MPVVVTFEQTVPGFPDAHQIRYPAEYLGVPPSRSIFSAHIDGSARVFRHVAGGGTFNYQLNQLTPAVPHAIECCACAPGQDAALAGNRMSLGDYRGHLVTASVGTGLTIASVFKGGIIWDTDWRWDALYVVSCATPRRTLCRNGLQGSCWAPEGSCTVPRGACLVLLAFSPPAPPRAPPPRSPPAPPPQAFAQGSLGAPAGHIYVWDMIMSAQMQQMIEADWVNCVRLNPSGVGAFIRCLVAGDNTGTIKIWQRNFPLNKYSILHTIAPGIGAINACAIDPAGETGFFGSVTGQIVHYHLTTGLLLGSVNVGSVIHQLSIHRNAPTYSLTCAAATDTGVHIVDMDTLTVTATLHSGNMSHACSFNWDGSELSTCHIGPAGSEITFYTATWI